MKIYLDNCCFNRPFDDQTQLRILLESEAKLNIQENVRSGNHSLVWSYILDYENSKNPFQERREQILKWRNYAKDDIEETNDIILLAIENSKLGLKNIDALHLACAIKARAKYFITTDDGILKRRGNFQKIRIVDPIDFIKEVTL